MVPRARSVRVRALNERGDPIQIEAEGWYARILQHEIDHLKGTIYLDRMWHRSFSSVDLHTRHWKSKSTAELVANFRPEP
jgi:peptide deformylase